MFCEGSGYDGHSTCLGIGKLGGRLERHQLEERQWAYVLPLHLNRVEARTPWNMIAAPTGSPNIIGLEYCHSDDACLTLDQSAVSSCLLLHAKLAFRFGALNNATITSMGSVSVLAR